MGELVSQYCCEWWSGGCGCDACFGGIADCLESVNPFMEAFADCIWLLGSPLAWPCIYFFPAGPPTEPPNGGWSISMNEAPVKRPCHCCFYMLCTPCGQWHMRRQALGGDMSRYKLWQGMHDGPHCLAARCPGNPCIVIESGTYGEENCPNAFLALEVTVLGGFWSPCCAHDVSRRLIRSERNLGTDPTEERVDKCIGFFSQLASQICMLSCCVCISGLLVGCCAPGSEGAQECSGEAGRAASSCRQCAYTCWRGIWSVKMIAIGCMGAQQDYELQNAQPLTSAPKRQAMDRGADFSEDADGDGEDSWWKKPPPGR